MASGAFCGFTAITTALASVIRLRGLMATPRQRLDGFHWMRLEYDEPARVKSACEPAFEHGRTHLSGAQQNQAARKSTQRLVGGSCSLHGDDYIAICAVMPPRMSRTSQRRALRARSCR